MPICYNSRMNVLFPFLGAILQSASFTLDKAILSVKKLSYKAYVGLSFPLLAFFDFAIFLIFKPSFSFSLLSKEILLMLFVSAAFSIGTNILYYRALEAEELGEMQTLSLLGRLPAILFAVIAFPEERSFFIILLAILSSLFIIWSHWENHKFQIKKNTLKFLVWFLFIVPFGGILSKVLLGTLNPIVLMLFQDGIVAIALSSFYFRDVIKISRDKLLFLLATNLFSSAGWILYFISIKNNGIIYTALLFSLQPVLTYMASALVLKEKIQKKKVIAFVAVLICAVVSQIIKPL